MRKVGALMTKHGNRFLDWAVAPRDWTKSRDFLVAWAIALLWFWRADLGGADLLVLGSAGSALAFVVLVTQENLAAFWTLVRLTLKKLDEGGYQLEDHSPRETEPLNSKRGALFFFLLLAIIGAFGFAVVASYFATNKTDQWVIQVGIGATVLLAGTIAIISYKRSRHTI